jgi:hypothetical protein
MADVVADLTDLNAARGGRGSSGPDASRLLTVRDRAEDALRKLGAPEPRVRAIHASFGEAIMRDLEAALWRVVQRKMGSATPATRLREVRREMTRRIAASRPGETASELRPYLEEVGGWSADAEPRLAQIDEFRRTGRVTSTAGRSTTPENGRSGG